MSEVIITDVVTAAVSVEAAKESVVLSNPDVIIGVDENNQVVEIQDDTVEVLVSDGSQALVFEAPVAVVELSASDVNASVADHESLFHYITDSWTEFTYDSNGMITRVQTWRDVSKAVRISDKTLIYDTALTLKQVIIVYYNTANDTVLLTLTKTLDHTSSLDLKSLQVSRS